MVGPRNERQLPIRRNIQVNCFRCREFIPDSQLWPAITAVLTSALRQRS